MQRIALALTASSLLLTACAVHLHVHEAEGGRAHAHVEHAHEPRHDHAARSSGQRVESEEAAGAANEWLEEEYRHHGDDAIRGRVLDAHGHEVKARVAVVTPSGSKSSTTDDDGSFLVDGVWKPIVVVTATTEDGRIGIRPAVPRGVSGVRIELEERPGGELSILMTGRESARVALFDGDVRFEDFTVRDGRAGVAVVPPRQVRVLLYGDGLEQEANLLVGSGGEASVTFHVDDGGASTNVR